MLIVLISPFPVERTALQELLGGDGHDVIAVATHSEGVVLAARKRADIVIADVQVAHAGIALARALAESGARARLILLCPRASGMIEDETVVWLTKPIHLDQLDRYIVPGRALDKHVA